jgi:hypothetical protein
MSLEAEELEYKRWFLEVQEVKPAEVIRVGSHLHMRAVGEATIPARTSQVGLFKVSRKTSESLKPVSTIPLYFRDLRLSLFTPRVAAYW